jgi:hypothetical protein
VKVLVCGSRRFTNPFRVSLSIHERLRKLPAGTLIIHGDASGADRMAAQSAAAHDLTSRAYHADWERHGKRAGIIRNLAMLDAGPDLVLAFWDGKSPGTAHTIGEARRRGIDVEVVHA